MYAELCTIRAAILAGDRDTKALETQATARLTRNGWLVDYVAIRRQSDLLSATTEQVQQGEPLVVLAAAKLGATRLIDNLEI